MTTDCHTGRAAIGRLAARRLVSWIAGLALAVPLSVTAVADDAASFDTVRELIAERFPNLEPDEISKSPVAGLVEIRQGAMVAYLSTDGRYLFRGDVIDMDRDTNLTEQAMSRGRLEIMSNLGDERGVTFAPDDPKYTVTVFTDVDCGWCRTLHRDIDDYMAQGIAVRYLMWPRGGPGSESWDKAERVWCSGNRQQALTKAKNDKALPAADCDASAVQRHFDVGLKLGVSGTPAIVTEDGELFSGYLPAQALAARLAGTPSVGSTR